jgi:regulatory protein
MMAKRRTPSTTQLQRPLTPQALERSALWHLGRRALTTAELGERLQKKAKKHPPHPLRGVCCAALGARGWSRRLAPDAKVARARVESGRARGLSRRRIALKLRGVDRDVADDAFAAVDAEHDDDGAPVDAEFAAAVVFATKKKLLQKEPQKALASLARQGFSFDVAKRALSSLRERDG